MKEIKINSANETIYTFDAPTKMPVYMWVNKAKTNVHMSLVIKYGSSDTSFTCNNVSYTVPSGTAHYLEHIKFNMKDADVNDLFFDLGCDTNAYTSLCETCYEVYTNNNIKEALKLLLDFVYDNYFTKKLIENERSIILEECNSEKDIPEYDFYLKNNESYLPKSNHRVPVIGYEKDIKKISLDDVSLVHEFFYRPENMFLVITGNFDKEELEKVINENEQNRSFKDIGKVKKKTVKETKKMLDRNIVMKSDKCSVAQSKYFIKSVLSDFKGYTKNEVLVALRALINTNFGQSSDFYEDVVLSGKATKFSNSVTYDDGAIGIVFSINSDSPKEVFSLIKEKLNSMTIIKEDINRIIKNNKTNSIMRYDNIYRVSSFIIASIIDNDVLDESKFEILKKLTPKKAMDIFKCVDLNNCLTSSLEVINKKETK